MRVFLGAVLALAICMGCGGEEGAQDKTALSSKAGMKGPMQGGPMMAQEKPTADDAAKLKKLETDYKNLKARYEKSPSNAKTKKQYLEAATKFGHESMVSPVLDTKVKYRQALRVYREVLKLDPKNPVAKPEYDLIVGIYKQMGRPIPKD